MNPRGDAGGPITVGICEDDLEFVEILKTNVFTLENGFEVVFTHGSAFEFIESIPIGVVMTRESARDRARRHSSLSTPNSCPVRSSSGQ